jgi:hypothetical protein
MPHVRARLSGRPFPHDHLHWPTRSTHAAQRDQHTGRGFDEFSDAALTVHPNGGGAVNIHSQYGEYVYEHERVSARATTAQSCLEGAGTNMQSVMDCWQRALKEVK